MCTLMAGVILILLGLTGLGTAVKYIPRPVVIGFTNGIGVLIASTQIRDFFGLQTPASARRLPRPAAACSSATPAPRPVPRRCSASVTIVRSFWCCGGCRGAFPAASSCSWPDPPWPSPLGLPVDTIGTRFGGVPSGLPGAAPADVPARSDPDAALAGADRGHARRDRVAALGGRRRSDVRRSPRPERRADGAGHRQRPVAAVRRPAGHRRDRAHGHEHPRRARGRRSPG